MNIDNLPDGFSQLVMIIQKGFRCDNIKMIAYMELYIEKYPKGDFADVFKDLINGTETNTVCLDTNIKTP